METIFDYILEQLKEEDLEEGFAKGLANEYKSFTNDMASLADIFYLSRGSVLPRFKKIMTKLKMTLKRIELDPNREDTHHGLLKFRQAFARWRFFYFLNDNVYKPMVDYAIKTAKDPIGWVDISFKDRVIPGFYTAKSTKVLIDMTEKYEKRVEHISKLVQQYPYNYGLRAFLRQGIYGARDWMIATQRLANYAAV